MADAREARWGREEGGIAVRQIAVGYSNRNAFSPISRPTMIRRLAET